MLLIFIFSCILLKNGKDNLNLKQNDSLELDSSVKDSSNIHITQCNHSYINFYLQFTHAEINCSYLQSIILDYEDFGNYTFDTDFGAYFYIDDFDIKTVKKYVEIIANTIQLNSKKNVFFIIKNIDIIGDIISYAKFFHEDTIEFWIPVGDNCIWIDKLNNVAKLWESKIKNTKWRKMCKMNSRPSKSFLHFSIDDDNQQQIKIMTKKKLIAIGVPVIITFFLMIISLCLIGYFCNYY